MATTKQRKLAQAIVQNAAREKPLNKAELLVSSGYSVSSAEASASVIMEQPGVKEELSALGFTEENAKAVTAKIMLNDKARDGDRLKAAELAFKVHGSFQPEATNERPSVTNIFNNPVFEVATRSYERSIIDLLRNGTTQPIQAEAEDITPIEGDGDSAIRGSVSSDGSADESSN